MNYQVLILRRAQKHLADLPSREYDRLKAAILDLSDNPRPHGSLKLTGLPAGAFEMATIE